MEGRKLWMKATVSGGCLAWDLGEEGGLLIELPVVTRGGRGSGVQVALSAIAMASIASIAPNVRPAPLTCRLCWPPLQMGLTARCSPRLGLCLLPPSLIGWSRTWRNTYSGGCSPGTEGLSCWLESSGVFGHPDLRAISLAWMVASSGWYSPRRRRWECLVIGGAEVPISRSPKLFGFVLVVAPLADTPQQRFARWSFP